MKNLSKRKRTIKSYKETTNGKYKSSDNCKRIYKKENIEKMDLCRLELELNFLKRHYPDDKLLISKCQKLIVSKKKQL
jgi:hypothetical protein